MQYALQGARGSLVAVYDAEDKPAPGQLLEAWAAFRKGDDRLAAFRPRWRLPIRQHQLAFGSVRT
jgi:cellulose synthase/poly-beta-1,6-N-acetylglucosamine synthase-like glycosyltransferase